MPRKSRYATKRTQYGGDSYGGWRNGEQLHSEKINGHTLIYVHWKGQWRGSVRED